jgi:hypothetical protein
MRDLGLNVHNPNETRMHGHTLSMPLSRCADTPTYDTNKPVDMQVPKVITVTKFQRTHKNTESLVHQFPSESGSWRQKGWLWRMESHFQYRKHTKHLVRTHSITGHHVLTNDTNKLKALSTKSIITLCQKSNYYRQGAPPRRRSTNGSIRKDLSNLNTPLGTNTLQQYLLK